jgi:hypothetical protein
VAALDTGEWTNGVNGSGGAVGCMSRKGKPHVEEGIDSVFMLRERGKWRGVQLGTKFEIDKTD